jgi:hypothetical protein
MDLVGQLSNPSEPLVRLLSIVSRPSKRAKRRSTKPKRSGYVEGRRRFGSVGKAVLTVLVAADKDLSAHEIRLGAEKLLGSRVSRHSIRLSATEEIEGP